jgi:hypothetical protein
MAEDLALGGSLRSRVERQNGETRVALSGNINERADLTPLEKLPHPLVIDLGGLQRINSIGVRNWMNFVRARESAGAELTFERLPPIMVGQMAMITRFMGARSRVKSVLVPYACPSCHHEHLQLLEVAPNARIEPQMPCPKCATVMELDEVVETYGEVLQSER